MSEQSCTIPCPRWEAVLDKQSRELNELRSRLDGALSDAGTWEAQCCSVMEAHAVLLAKLDKVRTLAEGLARDFNTHWVYEILGVVGGDPGEVPPVMGSTEELRK